MHNGLAKRRVTGTGAQSSTGVSRGREVGNIPETSDRLQMPSAVIGRAAGVTDTGLPIVDFPENPEPRPIVALSTFDFQHKNVGCDVLLVFERGDCRRPVVIGVLNSQKSNGRRAVPCEIDPPKAVEVQRDGERVVITADREIVLQCGKASITLTRAGKIILRGAYVLSRSSGVNKIQGGSVQIN